MKKPKKVWNSEMMVTNQVTMNDLKEAIKYMELDPLGDIDEINWNFPRDDSYDESD